MTPYRAKFLEKAVEWGLKEGLQECQRHQITDEQECFQIIHRKVVDHIWWWYEEESRPE